MRRKTLTVLMLAAAVAAAGCGGNDASPTATDDATTTTLAVPGATPSLDPNAFLIDEATASALALEFDGPYEVTDFELELCPADRIAQPGRYDGSAASASNDDNSVVVDEAAWVWTDADAAAQAFQRALAAVSCTTGTLDAEDVTGTFDLPALDTGTIFGDESFAVSGTLTVEDQSPRVTIAGIRKGNTLVVVRMTVEEGTANAPDPGQVVRSAATRIGAAPAG